MDVPIIMFKVKAITMIENKTEDKGVLDVETIRELWAKTYNTEGRPDWSHIMPHYDDYIIFRDSIQEIKGIADFRAMTERLTKRSKDLRMSIVEVVKQDNIVFIEWEMTIKYRNNPSSVLYGSSRLTINESGKIAEQRDYFDLWGDIFDNIPGFGKAYRKFMRRKFG
jgi:hypothetical protein